MKELATGRWLVRRSPKSGTAEAVALPGATLDGLADAVGLDRRGAWLPPSGRLPTGEMAPLAPLLALPDGAPEALPAGLAVEVPNRVIMLWMGDCGWLGQWAVGWASERDYLQRLGFSVRELAPAPGDGGEEQLLAAVAEESQARALHGLFYTGHGSPGSIGGRYGPSVRFDDLLSAMPYRLALAVFNCCHGGWSASDAPEGAPWPWEFAGPDGAGGRDLVSGSPCSRFHGVKHILWPRLVAFPGHARRCRDVLRPGEQGTQAG